ncbi:hypothetical protein GCM10017784_38260 [Deinococcus indicus]|nr:ParB/RepB/Spo0J family partition protein [Deinococcus sp. 23YEL01]PIG95969.1 chromosome partitioning protein ParB [Deinococcus sp. UR1]GHG39699.1 hypothetical protein GCM10017784_38260 [Deinococcus indicus]
MTRRGLSAGLERAGAFGGQQSVADLVSGQSAPRAAVKLAQIDPPKNNPRGLASETVFTNEHLADLIVSIRERGVLQPILVRPSGDRFEVVAGERRYRAALAAGLTEIPAVVKALSDDEAFEFAIIENTQREDMPTVDLALSAFQIAARRTGRPVEEMPALFLALKNGTAEDEWNLSLLLQSVMGSKGSSFSSFAQVHSRYLELTPAELSALRTKSINDAVARALTRLPQDHPERSTLLDSAIRHQWTAAEVESQVKQLLAHTPTETAFHQQVRQMRKVLPALNRLPENDQRRQRAEQLMTELLTLITQPPEAGRRTK